VNKSENSFLTAYLHVVGHWVPWKWRNG